MHAPPPSSTPLRPSQQPKSKKGTGARARLVAEGGRLGERHMERKAEGMRVRQKSNRPFLLFSLPTPLLASPTPATCCRKTHPNLPGLLINLAGLFCERTLLSFLLGQNRSARRRETGPGSKKVEASAAAKWYDPVLRVSGIAPLGGVSCTALIPLPLRRDLLRWTA